MKRLLTILLTLLVSLTLAMAGFAGTFDEKCAMCHKPGDKPAKSKETLLKQFKTADELIKAAKASTNPMMRAVQGNDELLKKAASELGLK